MNLIAVDTETTGLNGFGSPVNGVWPARPFFVSFTNYEGETWSYRFPVDPETREVDYGSNSEGYKAIKEIMEDPTISKVMHNAVFDMTMLALAGIKTKGKVFDTKTMAHILNPSRATYALKPLAKALAGIEDDDETALKESARSARREAKKKGWPISEDTEGDYHLVDPVLLKVYGERDTERTMALFWAHEDEYNTNESYKELVDMECSLAYEVVFPMQWLGVRLSLPASEELKSYYGSLIESGKKKMAELGIGELNTKSSKQMQELFYGRLGLPQIKKKKSGNPTTDSKALARWATQGVVEAQAIVSLNAALHQMNGFVEPLSELMREEPLGSGCHVIHPNFNINGPITGRMSCSKPNLQNIPSYSSGGKVAEDVAYRIREAFIPRDGMLWYLPDYSQIEVWTSMFLAQDKFGMECLLSGMDMHGTMAKRIWGTRPDFNENFSRYRKRAKYILFGLIYGSGVSGIMDTAGCSYEEAKAIRELFHDQFSGIFDYMERLSAQGLRYGFITSPFGRRYPVDRDYTYKSLNYMVQGSCADIMKRALLNIRRFVCNSPRWCGTQILLTVHDEVGIEVPKRLHSNALMKEVVVAMQSNFHDIIGIPRPYPVGMKVAVESWADAKEVEVKL